MKLILGSCFCLIFSFSFGQKGYKVIHRADKEIEKGNYKKAAKLLDKAESMNYGFCGLAWIEAQQEIVFHRTKILFHQQEYVKAANELNRLDFYETDLNVDSLKMAYFAKGLDKRILKNEIDSCLEAITSIDTFELEYEFVLNVSFSEKPFKVSYYSGQRIYSDTFFPGQDSKNLLIIDRFRKSVKNQTFYKLLL